MSHVSCRVFLTLFELASLAVWLQGKTQGRVECARVLWGAYGLGEFSQRLGVEAPIERT